MQITHFFQFNLIDIELIETSRVNITIGDKFVLGKMIFLQFSYEEEILTIR